MVEQEIILRGKLDLLLRTGEILVESAADTSHIVRNMNCTVVYLGLPEENLHINVTYTMLVVDLSDGSYSYSKFQKYEKHGINTAAISEINKPSQWAIGGDYSFDQCEEELEKIKNRKRDYVPYLMAIEADFACNGFCKLSGSDWIAFLFASIAAFAGFRVRTRCVEFDIDLYMSTAITVSVSTYLIYTTTFTGMLGTPYHPLLVCALFIVPGVPVTNFVDDVTDSCIQVGIVYVVSAVLMVCIMALDIVIAMHLLAMKDVVINRKFSESSMVPHGPYYIYTITTAISTMGLFTIFNIQRRLLWVATAGGTIAICTRNSVNFELGSSPVIGSFTGATVVSSMAVEAVHQFRMSSRVLTIPSVIPVVPRVLIYHTLVVLINIRRVVGEVMVTASNDINASLIILRITLGVVVPNISTRRYVAKDRRRSLQEELQKHRERGNFFGW